MKTQTETIVDRGLPSFRVAKHGLFIFLCLFPALLLVTVFIYYPLFKGVIMAFQNYSLFDLNNIDFIGLGNFKTILADAGFKQSLLNSFYWVFCSLIPQLIIGFIVALLLRKKFRGRGIYQSFIFFPWAMSGFLIGLIWRWMLNGQGGVINDLLIKLKIIHSAIPFLADPTWAMVSVIVANVWYGITFFSIMILAALQSIPDELFEAAKIDGANYMQQLFKITIPYILPTLIVTTLLRVIWILNFPDLIYSLTNGGPAGSTHILSTYMIDKLINGQNYGQAAAVGVMMMIILLFFAVFYLLATKFNKAGDF
ncbi:carbohydrate ABC transporter permease [Neobacillus ginsengisoli]|uniref:Multiple sugar transport system permease protein n=1 Tax=Neobacillus ginsengisoli TaxID=904295 RepID=A0ABT9XXK6_9BACI|nr:sugar ABC transporter permease [Neobacillus ginsengisoli]MDQ0200301.1 multiple sugar transport system permease protein [Neobacillus ginsengisoli]